MSACRSVAGVSCRGKRMSELVNEGIREGDTNDF